MITDFLLYIFVLLAGTIIGSFLNVCIYRIPKKISLLWPPSTCPKCNRRLSPLELFPVLSFIIQKGKCRGCKEKISWRYPMVELLTGLVFLSAFIQNGFTVLALKYCILFSLMIVIAFIDFDLKIIPDILSIPGAILGLALSYQDLWGSIQGLLVGFIIIFLVVVLSRGGMGMGDAKLLAMIGAFTGWKTVLVTLFTGSVLGSIVGVALLLSHKIERKTPIPFGPYLCIGAWLAIILKITF